jgi:hypothetical protein
MFFNIRPFELDFRNLQINLRLSFKKCFIKVGFASLDAGLPLANF